MKKIELLNSEGPVLLASWNNTFSIEEEPQILLKFNGGRSYVLTVEELKDYLAGRSALLDGDGKRSVFPDYSKDMKASDKKILKFLNYEK